MSKLVIMTGPCCAGKTAFVKKMEEEGALEDFDIISPEEVYESVNGSAADRSNREWAWLLIWHKILANMKAGVNTLVDANAPTECSRTQYLEWFRDFDEHILICVDTDLTTLHSHNKKRIERKLCDWDLITQWRNYDSPRADRHIKEWDLFEQWSANDDGTFDLMFRQSKGEF